MNKKMAFGVCVLGAFLALLSLGLKTRAAAPARWKAALSATGNLVGDPARASGGSSTDYVYDDAESAVDVYATIGTINSSHRGYRTIFKLIVYPPAKVFFNDIIAKAFYTDSALIANGFPDPGRPGLFDFLNGPHPFDAQFASVQVAFFGPFTSSREEADWETWPIGVPKPMRLWISVDAKNLNGDCTECDPENYHSVEVNSFDAVLVRRGPNEWTASVTATFDDPEKPVPSGTSFDGNYSMNEFIAEKYCECIEIITKKTTSLVKTLRRPAWGSAMALDFQIRFLKS